MHPVAEKLRTSPHKKDHRMGASQSSSSIYAYNKIANEVALSSVNTCIAKADTSTNLTQSNTDNGPGGVNVMSGIDISSNSDALNQNCSNQQVLSSAVSNSIAQEMDSESESTPPSLFAGEVGVFSSSSSNVTAVNDVLSQVDLTSFNTCISDARSSVNASQTGNKNIMEELTLNQNSKAMLQNCANRSRLGSSIANALDQDLSSTSKSTSNLSGIFELIILLVVVLVLAYVVYAVVTYYTKNKNGGSTVVITDGGNNNNNPSTAAATSVVS